MSQESIVQFHADTWRSVKTGNNLKMGQQASSCIYWPGLSVLVQRLAVMTRQLTVQRIQPHADSSLKSADSF